jgi:protein SCO1
MSGERDFARWLRDCRAMIGSSVITAVLACAGCGGGGRGPSSSAAPPPDNTSVYAKTSIRVPASSTTGPGATPAKRQDPQVPGASGEVTTKDYALKGVVVSVSPEGGPVRIRHEEIPGFMAAMTMPFRLSDESILGLLHPGDRVEGVLHVESQYGAVRDYQVRDLKVTQPAPPKAFVLDVSKEKVQLRQQPPRLKVGEEVPDFVMTGQDGKPVKLSDLRDKVIVLTFIYTRCPMPDFCPLMDRKFSELAQHLNAFPKRARDIRLISLSFDPDNDTPEILRKHAAMRGAIPPLWSYAVASHEELAKIAPRLGLFFGQDGKEIAHNLVTAIIDPQGKLARLEVGGRSKGWDTPDFLKTIYGLLPVGEK